MSELTIKNLHASIEGKEILKGIDLEVLPGEVTVIMGPNGSGKSTLANVIMGHPSYDAKGKVTYKGKNVLEMKPDERSKLGLFLSFQYPNEVQGVTLSNFLRTAVNAHRDSPISVPDFVKLMKEKMKMLEMDPSFMNRYLNQGFSGGEKKRAEILQLAVLNPSMAILDETDSGLDIDALKVVANSVNKIIKGQPDMGFLIITHYQRLLNYIKPDKVHVLVDGKIVKSGNAELALHLEEMGYDWVKD
ncbi:Fe-S cluster assembly ATPase SufC [Nanoarchaeota archaeon]